MSYMMWTKKDAISSLDTYSIEELDEFKALIDGLLLTGIIPVKDGERSNDNVVMSHFATRSRTLLSLEARDRYIRYIPIIAGAFMATGDVMFASSCEPYLSDRQKSLWIYLAQLCRSVKMGVPHIYTLLNALKMNKEEQ